MNIELIQCEGVGDYTRELAVDGLKKGMDDVYGLCSGWMDGWELEVYKTPDWHPDCTDSSTFRDSCYNFLNSIGETEPIAYHFITKCGAINGQSSYRDNKVTWDRRGVSSIKDDNRSFGDYMFQIRAFHEVLHQFIDDDLPEVDNLMYDGDEHTLGQYEYSALHGEDRRTVMADIYHFEAENGWCSEPNNDTAAAFNYSTCTLDSLEYTSNDVANS
jgi:hypothetical protein